MNMLDAALQYASLGWHVFPLGIMAKTPITPNGHKAATTDTEQIRAWWSIYPDANIGVACEASGLVIIDIDQHPNGADGVQAFDALQAGRALPVGPASLTGSGNGKHLWFLASESKLKGKLAEGIDIKTNGYVVAPPSIHPNGLPYQWQGGQIIKSLPGLCPMPDWLLELCRTQYSSPTAHTARVNTPKQLNLPQSHGELIIARCAFMSHWAAKAETLSEPEWFHGVGVLAHTVDGVETIHKYSSRHPGYSEIETNQKIANWLAKVNGPAKCETIKENLTDAYCKNCPFS